MAREVRALKGFGVVAFPNVSVALRVDFKIEPALLIEHGRKPWIVAPIRLNDDSIVRLLSSQEDTKWSRLYERLPSRSLYLVTLAGCLARGCEPNHRLGIRDCANVPRILDPLLAWSIAMAGDSNLANMGGNGFIWILLVAAGTYFVAQQQVPLQGSRPASTERSIDERVGEQLVDARLWQDPFAAVADYLAKSPSLQRENCYNGRYKDIETYCRPPLKTPAIPQASEKVHPTRCLTLRWSYRLPDRPIGGSGSSATQALCSPGGTECRGLRAG